MTLLVAEYSPQITAAVVLFALFYTVCSVRANPISKVPGPWYTRWTDVVSRYHWFYGRETHYIHDLHRKYGPIVRLSPNAVSVADIEAVKTIYNTRETFRKSEFYGVISGRSEQSLFSTADVDRHRKLRRLLASQLSETSLSSMMPQVTSHVERAVQKMKEESEARGVIDVLKWSLFMTTDLIGELSFGESFRMLEKGKKTQYTEDLETLASVSAYRMAFPGFFNFAGLYANILPVISSKIAIANRMVDYSRQSLERYQKQIDMDPVNTKQTFFSKLFKAEEDEKIGFDDILTNAQTFIIAGSDTTAVTLTYFIWSVCRRPELRDALVKELQTLPRDFADSDLRELPLLNQTVDETLRLYSSVPSTLPREVPAGGANFGGYYLREGTTVGAQAYTLHRDPVVFENPKQFDPKRWANPTKAMKEAFMPFGRGARICIGLHLAYIEIRLAAARFLLEFPTARVSASEGMSDMDMEETMNFLMSPRGKRCLIEV